ncbi:hypothetical protein [Sporisorium scitamineum]|uniref:Uncharacterized protein n=1 Tax=Sporisorium scitamineum TaxID=49012 RepID=A0A0F7S280_9BASI|nr:hypothetical protein [Sporisorium scitamineum]
MATVSSDLDSIVARQPSIPAWHSCFEREISRGRASKRPTAKKLSAKLLLAAALTDKQESTPRKLAR